MGTDGNCLSGLISSRPCFMSYRFDITSSRSEQVLTGRKRLRGTLIPIQAEREDEAGLIKEINNELVIRLVFY